LGLPQAPGLTMLRRESLTGRAAPSAVLRRSSHAGLSPERDEPAAPQPPPTPLLKARSAIATVAASEWSIVPGHLAPQNRSLMENTTASRREVTALLGAPPDECSNLTSTSLRRTKILTRSDSRSTSRHFYAHVIIDAAALGALDGRSPGRPSRFDAVAGRGACLLASAVLLLE
jgi:hypothetical protein